MATSMIRAPHIVLLALCTGLWGQSRPVLMGAGYEYPTPVPMAPGQLVTLFVQGLPNMSSGVRAPGNADLPTTLAGISGGITQQGSGGVQSWSSPILGVTPFEPCLNPDDYYCYAAPTTAVTLQIPFEMEDPYDVCISPRPGCGVGNPGLGVAAAGQVPFGIEVIPLPDKVHILKGFDSVLPFAELVNAGPCAIRSTSIVTAAFNVSGLPCSPLVTHANGTLVSSTSPAKSGEELVAYAVGLGQTSPPSQTGKLVTKSAPALTTFTLDFNYRPNALPTRPPPPGVMGVTQALYAGSVAGAVGLYQINFIVPPVPPGTPACGEWPSYQRNTNDNSNMIYSNLTVSVGGRFSFDGAGICVDVGASQTGGGGNDQ